MAKTKSATYADLKEKWRDAKEEADAIFSNMDPKTRSPISKSMI
jgi:hypothetical protein